MRSGASTGATLDSLSTPHGKQVAMTVKSSLVHSGIDWWHWPGGAVRWIRVRDFMGGIVGSMISGSVVIECLGWWLLTAGVDGIVMFGV